MAIDQQLAAARQLIASQYPLGASHEPQQALTAALVVAGAVNRLTEALTARSAPPATQPPCEASQALRPPAGEWINAADRVPTPDESHGGMVWVRKRTSPKLLHTSHLLLDDRWKPFISASDWITHRLPTDADGPVVIIPIGDGTTKATIDGHLVVLGQPWAPADTNPGPYPF